MLGPFGLGVTLIDPQKSLGTKVSNGTFQSGGLGRQGRAMLGGKELGEEGCSP